MFKISLQLFVFSFFIDFAVQGQAPPPAGFPGVAPTGPAVDIVHFDAAPDTVQGGQSATLRWEVRNAYSLTIDGLGPVATRGSQTVTPLVTTVYTLRVAGTGGSRTAQATVTVPGTVAIVANSIQATIKTARAFWKPWADVALAPAGRRMLSA